MKVLHLPVNVASIPFHTVRGLRNIGIDAKAIIVGKRIYQSSDGLIVIPYPEKNNIKRSLAKILFSCFFFKMAKQADIIHWYFGSSILPWSIDVKYIKMLNKPALVEWLGSDIRNPEIEFIDNPYYKKAFPFATSSKQAIKAKRKQLKFAHAGFEALVPPCMFQYLIPDIWQGIHIIRQRIMVSDYKPCYPEPTNQLPLIVHAPTNPVIKGTSAVITAIEKLKKKYKFDFCLVHNLPREDALSLIKKADIFLDQFIIGSHGMASLEAMAYGKPVVCYIKPSLISVYPEEIPIVNANPDNLEQVLEKLIIDGKLRYETGKKSRDYVEKYHDALKLATQLKEIYTKIIQKKRKVRL